MQVWCISLVGLFMGKFVSKWGSCDLNGCFWDCLWYGLSLWEIQLMETMYEFKGGFMWGLRISEW